MFVSSRTVAQAVTADSIYSKPDKVAQFGNGDPALYLASKVTYSVNDSNSNASGDVTVRFTVDKNGNARSPRVLKSTDPSLEGRVMTAVVNMPRWLQPAEKGDRKVDSYVELTIPVTISHNTVSNRPYNEKMPEFPGEMDNLIKYLAENIKYPSDARRKKIEGKVIVKFVIDDTGRIMDPIVLHSLYPSLDAEAIRVVTNMPLWSPGEQNGQKVKVYFTIPVMFRLLD